MQMQLYKKKNLILCTHIFRQTYFLNFMIVAFWRDEEERSSFPSLHVSDLKETIAFGEAWN